MYSSTSVTEAVSTCFAGPPSATELEAMYPNLADHYAQNAAWMDDNRDKLKEAVTVLIACRPDNFEPGASVEKPGSFFSATHSGMRVPIYWNPSSIVRRHEGVFRDIPKTRRCPTCIPQLGLGASLPPRELRYKRKGRRQRAGHVALVIVDNSGRRIS